MEEFSLENGLATNAFDFLEKAVKQVEKEPKYSVINFATAVELFLKLRLVHEHWSLIDTSRYPNLSDLNKGTARTISFIDLMPKIKSVTGYIFSQKWRTASKKSHSIEIE